MPSLLSRFMWDQLAVLPPHFDQPLVNQEVWAKVMLQVILSYHCLFGSQSLVHRRRCRIFILVGGRPYVTWLMAASTHPEPLREQMRKIIINSKSIPNVCRHA